MTRWPYPRIVAHRGGGTLAPENTLAAIRCGAELGFRGVEFDVMLSRDGVPVLIHDETLLRTAGRRGRVAHTDFATLETLDAGAWRGRRWRGERIPSLAAAGALCRELGLWANVEIKPANGYERRTGEAVARAARALWQGAPLAPVLSSFSPLALGAAREAAPELPRGLLLKRRIPPHWLEMTRDLECVALHCEGYLLTQALVRAMHEAGIAVLAWTVNDRRTAKKLLRWGVDCLVTDAVKRIGPAFAAQKPRRRFWRRLPRR
jgi:glycerophosphoryl diester phosphodiesterase